MGGVYTYSVCGILFEKRIDYIKFVVNYLIKNETYEDFKKKIIHITPCFESEYDEIKKQIEKTKEQIEYYTNEINEKKIYETMTFKEIYETNVPFEKIYNKLIYDSPLKYCLDEENEKCKEQLAELKYYKTFIKKIKKCYRKKNINSIKNIINIIEKKNDDEYNNLHDVYDYNNVLPYRTFDCHDNYFSKGIIYGKCIDCVGSSEYNFVEIENFIDSINTLVDDMREIHGDLNYKIHNFSIKDD